MTAPAPVRGLLAPPKKKVTRKQELMPALERELSRLAGAQSSKLLAGIAIATAREAETKVQELVRKRRQRRLQRLTQKRSRRGNRR
jgi:hypothetical protein